MVNPRANDRLPPHNDEAEMCVLGSMLIDNKCIDDVLVRLGPSGADYFYASAHREIFGGIVQLFTQGRAVDFVLLQEYLDVAKLLHKIGGLEYLTRVVEIVPSAANVERYAVIVRDKAIRRRVLSVTAKIEKMIRENENDPVDDLVSEGEKLLFKTTGGADDNAESIAMSQMLKEAIDRIDEIQKRGTDELPGLSTGFIDLDAHTGGMHDAELILLAARPSVGKTALAMNIAANVARKCKPVAVFSLEMSPHELSHRFLSGEAEVNSLALRKGRILPEAWTRLGMAFESLSPVPLWVDAASSHTGVSLRARARRMCARHGIRLLIIDYLQLMESGNKRENRVQDVSDISRSLKVMARELNIPILALSQLNRASESRSNPEPKLSDLRESGSLEQDADMVWLLHKKNEADRTVSLHIAKQRQEPQWFITLTWQPEFVRFLNYAPDAIAGKDDDGNIPF